MNVVFCVIIIVGIAVLGITSPDTLLSVFIDGSAKGVSFAVRLFCIYAVWLSVLQLWRKLTFDTFLAKKLKNMLVWIFPKESDECYRSLSINLSANLLGMGSAGTPAGMRAIAEMENKKNRVMLLVINSTSVQLLPTTVIAMRSAHGATTDIILPTLLSTLLTTLLGAFFVKIFIK